MTTADKVSYPTVSEAGIEDLVVRDPSALGEDFVLVKQQARTTDGGIIDLLLRDANRRAVVVELKAVQEDGALLQGLSYLAWVHENLHALALEYPGANFNVSTAPRLVLVAPTFSPNLKKVVRYFEEPPTLIQVKVIEHKGERLLIAEEADVVETPVPIAPAATRDGFRDYISDESVRSVFDIAMKKIFALSPDITENPRQQYLALRRRGSTLAVFWTKRKFFHLGFQTVDGWESKRIQTAADLESVLQDITKVITVSPA
jgi:hypothetical protein